METIAARKYALYRKDMRLRLNEEELTELEISFYSIYKGMTLRRTSPNGHVFVSPDSPTNGILAVLYDFDTDGDHLKSNHTSLLDDRVIPLLLGRETHIILEGHASPLGSEEHNMDLSRRRVANVVTYLRQRRVRDSQILSSAVGESRTIMLGVINDQRDRSVIILVRPGDQIPVIRRNYKIHMRCFAPWRRFGGILPESLTPDSALRGGDIP